MNAQLLKESNNEKIVAPIIRNLKPKFNKKEPKKLKGKSIPTKSNLVFKFRDLIFFKLEPKNRVGLQNIRN